MFKAFTTMQISQIFFGLWSVLFVLFAYWQCNDPDPEIWVTIYGITAILCALSAFRRYFISMMISVAIITFVGGLYFFPLSVRIWVLQEWQQMDLSMKTIDMEEARESFGLLIVSVIMVLGAYRGFREKRSNHGGNKPRTGVNSR